MSRRFRFVAATLAVAFALGFTTPLTAQTVTADNVGEMVQKARTPAEHTALAEYFRAQAKAASMNAQKHRAMLVGGPPKSSRQVWDAHCERLIRSYEAEAAALTDLAKEQDVLAKHARQAH